MWYKENDINHSLSCKKGGFVILRHNNIRDTTAKLLEEVCYDVQIEPRLIPIAGEMRRFMMQSGEI